MRRIDLAEKLSRRDVDVPVPAHPLIEITGERRVLIEHHQGVVAYGCAEICVRVRYGVVQIRGSSLHLAKMTAEQLVVCGRIDGVELLRSGR